MIPLLREHVQLQRLRRQIPRSVKRLERAHRNGLLKPEEYEAHRAQLGTVAQLLPAIQMEAFVKGAVRAGTMAPPTEEA